MAKKEPEQRTLIPLIKYLEILVDSYPEPIRAIELADKTDHTKAAISKVRDRLLQLCDQNRMVFEKGFVLSESSDLILPIFIVFLAHGEHRRFLRSRFFRALINPKKIHRKIAKEFLLYGERFTMNETEFLIQKFIESIDRLPEKDFKFLLKLLSAKKPNQILQLKSLTSIQPILNKLEFIFNNKEELLIAITIRDKFFFMIRDFLWAYTEGMEILKKQDLITRKNYISVYKNTIDFYLRVIFERIEPSLLKASKKFLKKNMELQIKIGASHLMLH